jgi:hypothetical protein
VGSCAAQRIGRSAERLHGGCSGMRFRIGGGRVAMEQPHKLLTSSRCWAAAWRHGRIPDFYPRLAAPLPDKGSTRQLRS